MSEWLQVQCHERQYVAAIKGVSRALHRVKYDGDLLITCPAVWELGDIAIGFPESLHQRQGLKLWDALRTTLPGWTVGTWDQRDPDAELTIKDLRRGGTRYASGTGQMYYGGVDWAKDVPWTFRW